MNYNIFTHYLILTFVVYVEVDKRRVCFKKKCVLYSWGSSIQTHLNRCDHRLWALQLRAEEARDPARQRRIHGEGLCFLELGGNDLLLEGNWPMFTSFTSNIIHDSN